MRQKTLLVTLFTALALTITSCGSPSSPATVPAATVPAATAPTSTAITAAQADDLLIQAANLDNATAGAALTVGTPTLVRQTLIIQAGGECAYIGILLKSQTGMRAILSATGATFQEVNVDLDASHNWTAFTACATSTDLQAGKIGLVSAQPLTGLSIPRDWQVLPTGYASTLKAAEQLTIGQVHLYNTPK